MQKKNVRLLHLVKSLEMGGIEKSTILYSNILVKSLDFVGIFAEKGFYDSTSIINAKVNRYFPKKPIRIITSVLSNLKNIFEILHMLKITHIHYHHRIYIPFIFFIKVFLPKITIIYSHHNIFNDYINRLIVADKIIAFNKGTKNDLPPKSKRKVTIIPHGIHMSKAINNSINKKVVNFGFVGRFVEWKGIRPLLREFYKVTKTEKKAKLFLIGDGPLRNILLNDVKKLDLEKSIVFVKPLINLTEIYKMIDVLILPSKHLEGFGVVLIEAMSFGIPVMVFENPVFDDIVIDNFNGVVIKKNISESIQDLLKHDKLFLKLSANARNYSKKYDIRKSISNFLIYIYI